MKYLLTLNTKNVPIQTIYCKEHIILCIVIYILPCYPSDTSSNKSIKKKTITYCSSMGVPVRRQLRYLRSIENPVVRHTWVKQVRAI